MGAGPSPRRVTTVARKALQRIAKQYGGTYNKGTPSTKSHIYGLDWSCRWELQRASNGEACLKWKVFRQGHTLQIGYFAEHLFSALEIPKAKG